MDEQPKKIKAFLAIDLLRPYNRSLDPLLDLCNIWSCDIVRIGTSKRTQYIAMPWDKFRKIWGFNPKKGKVKVPSGTEDYIETVEVLRVGL